MDKQRILDEENTSIEQESGNAEDSMLEKPHNVTRTHRIIGIILVIISNLLYLGNNYMLKIIHISATEVASTRGLLQIFMFGLLVFREKRKSVEKTELSCKTIAYLILYGILMSAMSFACLAAIPLMPIGDLIVLAFTGPAFTVFLAFLILKQELTVLKIFLSFTIIGGDILVVQPPFIFGSSKDTNPHHPNSTYSEDLSVTELEGSRDYYVGVGLCLLAAVAGSTARIYSTKLSSVGVSNNILMLSAGIFNFLSAFAFIPFIPNRLLNGEGLSREGYYSLPLAAGITLVAFWAVTLALDYLRDPTLVGMLRSTEILFSMVSESVYNNALPDYISLTGSTVVLICVCCMAIHDGIQRSILETINRIKKEMEEQRNLDNEDHV